MHKLAYIDRVVDQHFCFPKVSLLLVLVHSNAELTRFTCFSWDKIWCEDFAPCKRIVILQLCFLSQTFFELFGAAEGCGHSYMKSSCWSK